MFLLSNLFLNDFLSINLNNLNVVEVFASLLFIFGYFILGLFDDKINLSPNKKIIFSIFNNFISYFFNEKFDYQKDVNLIY